jgi:threonine/homoserine/homoserine lactone efflux protein
MIYYLITGITLGLSSGLSPGPLFVLVVSETLNYGRREGIKVAITPLITDIPIIVIAYFIIDLFANSDLVYGILSLGGGLFIAYLVYDILQPKDLDTLDKHKAQSIRKGITANLLNPSPYIFWIMVGIPTVFKGFNASLMHALLFVVPFYVFLIGSKITMAILISKSGRINAKILRRINIVLAIVLSGLAVKFIYDGIRYISG